MILALDSSGGELLVALVEDGRLLAGTADPGPRHQDRVFEAIAEIAGERLAEIEAIAVGRGPGSHTGLRVGLSAALGMAFARRLPIYPLSSLAVAAHRVGGGQADQLLALVAAGRGRVHGQMFDRDGAGWRATGTSHLMALADVDRESAVVAAEPPLLAQLALVADGRHVGGADALAAAVRQAVSAKEAVNYDGLSGDYGDSKARPPT